MTKSEYNNREYRKKCFDEYGQACAVCATEANVVAHHVDGNQHNNAIENLLPLCRSCHTRVHANTESERDAWQIRDLRDALLPLSERKGQTTISLTERQKRKLEETQDFLEQENGYKPSLGDTVKVVCEALQEVRA